MDMQTGFMALLAIAIGCVSWWVRTIWSLCMMQQTAIQSLHVKLAENYAPRAEIEGKLDRIFKILDEIRSEVRK